MVISPAYFGFMRTLVSLDFSFPSVYQYAPLWGTFDYYNETDLEFFLVTPTTRSTGGSTFTMRIDGLSLPVNSLVDVIFEVWNRFRFVCSSFHNVHLLLVLLLLCLLSCSSS
jgi:hypothetical protein